MVLNTFSFTSQASDQGVRERHFVLEHGDVAVPGVLWTPDLAAVSVADPRPLVLIGHGGGQSKSAPGVVARAHRLVTERGFAAVAIDAPGHGDRTPTDEHAQLIAALRSAAAEGRPVGPHVTDMNSAMARWTAPEWRAMIDALQEVLEDGVGIATGPIGYWGVSMGAAIGIPLAVMEPRITACVFGLVGTAIASVEAAARVTVPVEFLMQWDDELVPRADGLALFDALGSRQKTLHANPGGHGEMPLYEIDSAIRFFGRQLSVVGKD